MSNLESSNMSKRFVEFDTNVYDVLEMKKYHEELDKEFPSDLMLPTPHISTVGINPDDICSYVEVYSMTAQLDDPEYPDMDQVSVNTYRGEEFIINCTLKEFKKKLENFYTSRGTESAIQ